MKVKTPMKQVKKLISLEHEIRNNQQLFIITIKLPEYIKTNYPLNKIMLAKKLGYIILFSFLQSSKDIALMN